MGLGSLSRDFALPDLKVDIEGAEKSLFAGPASVLGIGPPIVMEPHDWLFPGDVSLRMSFQISFPARGRELMPFKDENVASISMAP